MPEKLKEKRIPSILKDGKLESDFKIKANYFNNFFASQCTPLVNNSKLPDKTKLLITLQSGHHQLQYLLPRRTG